MVKISYYGNLPQYFYNIGPMDRIYIASFSSQLRNGLNKLVRYIALCWKGLPGANTLAYFVHS